ncbi:hydroxymethylbilane synthase [Syntrophotalea carbinolica DSM 2380]|uniref:Porphobilinogen deaminase n=1 Tax=Syntrophotalea carbinolica (strain DSM 2380 / NBRC 103641 / GraBd1) TaxID=338963 RepID=HEM3_SYNC1|nr:hydroxymethylbilane synthase [Syntrophotalea carbinolica]Q3A009.1 RecName: Full=Porphobilinogen deaminase; Short=PBG; AltName: Full=Hydroxymethylbilane synthase; Short=HMBS; AltName: Full=Pre-uroporphyrinogen synthase [Syntrophotalea carbinolica DSM 2380]ABA90298.1 hydroxymethylbilane synthase [Syntrophotalea carbinolica DSM 2380]
MSSSALRIGTRASRLALWQAEWVQQQLETLHPGLSVVLVPITTKGDKILDVPLAKVGGKGLFVKEIEEALYDGSIDLAVHSMKDVPSVLPPGLILPCIPPREDPRDALVTPDGRSFAQLPQGARIGTSALRRQAQLLHRRPDLDIVSLRGNVETRLRKMEEEDMDGIVLAAAGLKRLELAERIAEYLSVDVSLPAIGQGALGLECREGDDRTLELIAPLHDADTAVAVRAERAFLRRLNGGCQVPLAAHATVAEQTLTMVGLVAEVDGGSLIKETLAAPVAQAEAVGCQLAETLLARGADRILAALDITPTPLVP